MINFKKTFKKILPYDKQEYLDFLFADEDSSVKWYGVSFQLPGVFEGKDIGLIKFLNVYESLFKNVVSKLDCGVSWIITHDISDCVWFPNNANTVTQLRSLFKENGIPSTFKGALIFDKDNLLRYWKDILSYPYTVVGSPRRLYSNLDVSYSALPFIIKISGHLTIDFLSTDENLLREVANANTSHSFILKEYRGTLLG